MRAAKSTTAALAALIAATAPAACGGDPDPGPPTTTISIPAGGSSATVETPAASTTEAPDPEAGEPPGPAETAASDPRVNARERDAARTARAYVAALDAGDGEGVCALLAPGALAGLPLPEPGDGCAESMTGSIGYRDPRGLPVWAGAEVARVRVLELSASGERAKVITTVVTRFADRAERSVEDDVIYLIRTGGRWLVAKPSSTLYRAVGIADVPPSVLSPPN